MKCGRPSAKQLFGAQVRAFEEALVSAKRRPFGGGFEIPGSEIDREVAERFGLTLVELSFFKTYSRHCTHAWSDGGCVDCPE